MQPSHTDDVALNCACLFLQTVREKKATLCASRKEISTGAGKKMNSLHKNQIKSSHCQAPGGNISFHTDNISIKRIFFSAPVN